MMRVREPVMPGEALALLRLRVDTCEGGYELSDENDHGVEEITYVGSKWDDDDYGPPAGFRTDSITGIVTKVGRLNRLRRMFTFGRLRST